MGSQGLEVPELRNLGAHILRLRLERGMSQGRLAEACGLSQAQVSLFESGHRLPSLEQIFRIARALDVPLEELLVDGARPKVELKDLAVELRRLGAVDLWVADAVVPAAARRPEEVISLAISGARPDPRIVEAVPALLSWNEINPSMLKIHGRMTKTTYRLAWLADIALAIDHRRPLPGGCRRPPLERFLKMVLVPPKGSSFDDLGMPAEGAPKSPIWRRWKIGAGMTLDDFERRALTLAASRAAKMRDEKVIPGNSRKVRRPRKERDRGG